MLITHIKLIDRYKLVLHSKIKQKLKLEEYRNVENNYKKPTTFNYISNK